MKWRKVEDGDQAKYELKLFLLVIASRAEIFFDGKRPVR